ncbi:hypothetical protein Mal15_31640 [Stieleria maiorica]|uniref:DUF1552 domain-containing protein n=1 Tax=Stieleria maiorica TaxID=2795974 RepID=A0A5B9MHJ5_9BACT|nr:DUF1552 domain-containing protein [Stieleria maiorica]QEF99104.1 hypothetical protein Mal15_31640 [Stieleria maiorica]
MKFTNTKLDRRTVLRGSGLAVGLPFLDAMIPAVATAAETESPRRFVSFSLGLGLHGPNLFPEESGADYTPSPYLAEFTDLLPDLTVCSGVSHPQVAGGHRAEGTILTAAPLSRSDANFRNSISLDQLMAKHLGDQTRFPSLVLNASGDNSSPSYTENGAMIPPEMSPSRLFEQLFVPDPPKTRQQDSQRMRHGRRVMDLVAEEAKTLQRTLGAGDRDKLDSYFTAVNELEKRLAANQDWINRPKPTVSKPKSLAQSVADGIEKQRAMFDVMALALQTDSSRFITLHLGNGGKVELDGVTEAHHALSHHGQDEEKLRQLAILENALLAEWANFVRKLKSVQESSGSLLDQTMVLLTSNLGNASSHDNKNMPVLFAGGGFKHGQHLEFDTKNNYPLPNLYLSALHRLGLHEDSFATSTSTMTGLELA